MIWLLIASRSCVLVLSSHSRALSVFTKTSTTEASPTSLHDALPISRPLAVRRGSRTQAAFYFSGAELSARHSHSPHMSGRSAHGGAFARIRGWAPAHIGG